LLALKFGERILFYENIFSILKTDTGCPLVGSTQLL